MPVAERVSVFDGVGVNVGVEVLDGVGVCEGDAPDERDAVCDAVDVGDCDVMHARSVTLPAAPAVEMAPPPTGVVTPPYKAPNALFTHDEPPPPPLPYTAQPPPPP